MFDILPPAAAPPEAMLAANLEITKEKCIAMFRELPVSIDRDGALSSLSRIGRPSLPKKVAHRVSIVERELGQTFPDLQLAAGVAVRCRNYLVHGGTGGIDFPRLEPFLPFLTDVLEFVFASSDFIDAGWNANRWNSEGHSWGHSFARFRWSYAQMLAELKKELAQKIN
jgi:hypothetical protein